MPIVTDDLEVRLSVTAGTAGNTEAGTPGEALGKYVATSEVVDATLHNLFPIITGDENAAEQVDYQCIFLYNSHATLTLLDTKVWVQSETAGGADAAISVDTTAASAVGSGTPQAKEIGDRLTAPAGQTFTAPTTKETGLEIGDLQAGQVRAVWIRRTATDSGPQDLDGVVLRFEGDTEE